VLHRSGFSAPMDSMMRCESGCSGQSSTIRFQGLSGGKTSSVLQIASASGVLNITGFVIEGIFVARVQLGRAGSPYGGCTCAPPTENVIAAAQQRSSHHGRAFFMFAFNLPRAERACQKT